MSFNKHIDHVIVKAKKRICAVRAMAAAQIQHSFLFKVLQLVVLSVIDYGLGCLTLSETQISRLEVVQNEAMRAVLGCTKDTHIVCMRYLLDLHSMKIRYKLAEAKMYLDVLGNTKHPLHHIIRKAKGNK